MGENLYFGWNLGKSKIEMFAKNWNLRQKLKFSSKIEIFVKNLGFDKKIEFLVKNLSFR